MENNEERIERIAEEIAQNTPTVIHEEEIEEQNRAIREQQLREQEENSNKTEHKLSREQIGSKAKGLIEIIKKHPKRVISSIGAIALITSLVSCATKCNNDTDDMVIGNIQTTSSTTSNRTEPVEKDEIVITTTTGTTTSTTKPVETVEPEIIEDEEIVVTKPVSTTTEPVEETKPVETVESEIIKDEEIVVTKPVSTTKSEPVEETKPVEKPSTTTKPVSTTTKTTTSKSEETEPVVIEEAEPIQIKDLDKKVKLLKETLTNAGIYATDELIENTVRILHSDFIAHDGFKEITDVKLEQALSLLASMGSVNNVTYNAGYMGYIREITEGVYIPAEVCPESSQKFITTAIKLAESYRLELNKTTTIVDIALTSEEEEKIQEEVMKELDKLNIIDNELYSQKFSELYSEKWMKIYNQKTEEQNKAHTKEAKTAYKEFYKTALELINSKEYEQLTPSEKIIVFTNLSGAFTSGMQEKHINKYEKFTDGIESSIDDARENMVIANSKNINQQEALDAIVENNKPLVKQEREDLKEIVEELELMYEDGSLLLR